MKSVNTSLVNHGGLVGDHEHLTIQDEVVDAVASNIAHEIDSEILHTLKIIAMNDAGRIIEYVKKNGINISLIPKFLNDVSDEVRKEVLFYFDLYGDE